MVNQEKIRTYTDAVKRGDYELYSGNLYGKYDNIRTFWEDQLTRFVIRPFLSKLVSKKQEQNKKLRILDMGCGSGQGYELITRIDKKGIDLGLHHDRILPEEEIEVYLGIDLNKEMVNKGNEIFANKPFVQFKQADLCEGLAAVKDENPFDIYFSSYGSLSHLSRTHLQELLINICKHGENGSLILLDLLGRYSIEWPCYWNAETEDEKVNDYSMSYLYLGSNNDHEVEHFPCRYWTGAEVEMLVADIKQEANVQIEILKKLDRSILVGRHTDTGQYNPKLNSNRRKVNSLHEDYLRTDLMELSIDPSIVPDNQTPAPFLKELVKSWNILVEYCQNRLQDDTSLTDLEAWSEYSSPLQFALMTIDRVITDTSWMWYGEPRANIIEPQLGYALRSLEFNMQKGEGCGHGLIAVLKISK